MDCDTPIDYDTCMLQKSDENIEAAKLLHAKEKYNCVIHCTYYALYQVICVIVKSTGYSMGEGSHEALINLLMREIKEEQRYDFNRATGMFPSTARNKIRKIKDARIKADYSPNMFDDAQGKRSIEDSQNVIDGLRKFFKK